MDIEKYRDLVNQDKKTMSSRDLHVFVYEATGKFKELASFHKKVREILQSHIDDSKMECSLNPNQTVAFYTMNEVQCNMVLASIDVRHLELMSEVFVAVKNVVQLDSYLIEDPIKRAEAWIVEAKAKEKALELHKISEEKRNLLIHQAKRYTASELASELGFGSAIALNKQLNEDNIIYKVNKTWKLYAFYESKNLTETKQQELDNGKIIYYMKWTGIGRDFLLAKYKSKREKQQKLSEDFDRLIGEL